MIKEKKFFAVISIIIFISFLIIIYRIYSIQVIRHEELDKYSQYSQVIRIIKGKRGTVYDRNGDVLAFSEPKIDIAVDPNGMRQKDKIAEILAKVTGVSLDKVKQVLAKDGNFFTLAKNVKYDVIESFKIEKDKVRKKFKEIEKAHKHKLSTNEELKALTELFSDFNFIIMVDGYRRVYPQGKLLANVLGSVRENDGMGLEGIELNFNKYLQGKERRIKRFYIPGTGEGSLEVEKELDGDTAGNLYTTIDARIQYIAEEELDKMMEKSKAKWGGVIVMDPANGKILAMANNPSYNPEQYQKYSPKEKRNYTIANLFEPGSTFKIFSIISAMNENLVKPNEQFSGYGGKFTYGKRVIRDHEALGMMTIKDIVVKSSNIGTVQIVDRLSSEKFFNSLTLFGFGMKTGIQLPGEASREIRPYKKWYPIDKGNLAFGQGISINMLQMVRAMATIFNGGVLWQPTIVDKIVEPKTEKIIYQSVPMPQRVEFRYNSDKNMIPMMKAVVDEGTAQKAAIKGIGVAGKTGTSQKYDFETKKFSWNRVVCGFVGVVPSDNPKMVMMVVLDEPAGREFGGSVAAPVFGNIAKRVLPLMGVLPEKETKKSKEEDSEFVENDVTETIIGEEEGKDAGPFELVKVPKITGMQLAKAIYAVNQKGLGIEITGKGESIVRRQYPDAGEMVPYGTVLTLETEDEKDKESKEE